MPHTPRRTHEVHLIDASPYVFRAYFSLPETLTDPSGRPVNAVQGFAGFLLQYIAHQRPTHLGLCFDEALTSSFRNDLYPAYKAQRELPPEGLEWQLVTCRRLAAALGAATYVDGRYEADDLLGTLAAQLSRKGHRSVVVSNDKDLTQLVDARTDVFDVVRERRYDADLVREVHGVWPGQVPDLLGLAGDAVDNIPGVPGVGLKTARALLGAFADMDAVYADLDAVAALPLRGAASVAARCDAGRELAYLSRELATIARDAPATARLPELKLTRPDRDALDPLLAELGFRRLAERIPARWDRT